MVFLVGRLGLNLSKGLPLQVRCRDAELCSGAGAKVVVTDQARTPLNRRSLVLSPAAYAAMARAGKAARLRDQRVVDVEYKRYLLRSSSLHVRGAVRKHGIFQLRSNS